MDSSMAVTTGQSGVPAEARWHVLLRPRWLGWHAFVVVATAGMLLLGNWQLRRAESGNELSWAYTFEWPLFSAFTIYFWIKSLRDELRGHGAAASVEHDAAAAAAPVAGTTTAAAPKTTASAAARAVETGSAASARRKPASWDATSWDAASWDATSQEADAAGTGKPVDVARATPADGEAYRARLMAEVRGPGRRRGRR
jgi:DNA-binding transcriptional regulator of glucitol operon